MKKVILAHEDSLFRVGLESIFSEVAPKSVFFYAITAKEILEIVEVQKIDVIIFSTQIKLEKNDENLLLKKKHDLKLNFFIIFHTLDYLLLLKWGHFGGQAFISIKDSHLELKEIFTLALKNEHLNFSKYIIEAWSYVDSLECLDGIKLNLLNNLSPKEMEVLILICEQYTNEEIAVIQCVSVNTVDTHRRNIFIKTGVRNMVSLCFYALKVHVLKSKLRLSKNLIIAILFWNKMVESITEINVIIC